MADDEPRARFSPPLITLAVGSAALLPWPAMLRYMFGDVL
ncbi:MAG: hypothetical protein QOE79_1778 [Sphingomonadales bacterium]|jgi:hypothetical protein|nr:hypothetical protein [Sphingomonadales bacterium]MEA3048674.1 hypothetical protein [Sphingomonadales bacterium]